MLRLVPEIFKKNCEKLKISDFFVLANIQILEIRNILSF